MGSVSLIRVFPANWRTCYALQYDNNSSGSKRSPVELFDDADAFVYGSYSPHKGIFEALSDVGRYDTLKEFPDARFLVSNTHNQYDWHHYIAGLIGGENRVVGTLSFDGSLQERFSQIEKHMKNGSPLPSIDYLIEKMIKRGIRMPWMPNEPPIIRMPR